MGDSWTVGRLGAVFTTVSLSIIILFCGGYFKINTIKQGVFAQSNSGNVTSLPQYILIESDTHWEGSILDSSHGYTLTGSYGDARFDIDCDRIRGLYSVVFDKTSKYGNLTISLVKNGTVLDTQTTTDSFGGVQIPGNC